MAFAAAGAEVAPAPFGKLAHVVRACLFLSGWVRFIGTFGLVFEQVFYGTFGLLCCLLRSFYLDGAFLLIVDDPDPSFSQGFYLLSHDPTLSYDDPYVFWFRVDVQGHCCVTVYIFLFIFVFGC